MTILHILSIGGFILVGSLGLALMQDSIRTIRMYLSPKRPHNNGLATTDVAHTIS